VTTNVTEHKDGSTTTTVRDIKTGIVTATTVTPEGGKTEKITTSERHVTITVTDPSGETLAKVDLPAIVPDPKEKFTDVPVGHWAEKAINQVAGLGVVNGVGNNKFDLNSNISRGDLSVILFRLSNGKTGYDVKFDDVSSDKYYADGIAWAARSGVVTGYTDHTFGPTDTISREQLAVMLYRYAKLVSLNTELRSDKLKNFSDGNQTHDWARDGMAWCVENGVIGGKGGGTLDPTGKATRAETAVMLQRFLNLIRYS